MIIQTAPEGRPRLAISMAEHTAFAGELGRLFGNDDFEPLLPFDEMDFVISHHDAGWAAYDENPGFDAETGLPYNLVRTPIADIVKTGSGSPDFNEAHHPYCGLISSMHSWGLYNGRYGLSDHVLMDVIPAEVRPKVQAMLDHERARQERLKEELAEAPETARWIEPAHLFQNYKQLQFFDTLSLYFHMTHEGARREMTFTHVPLDSGRDVDVVIRPRGEGRYELHPFPFSRDGASVSFSGRYLAPAPDAETMRARLKAAPRASQTVVLCAA